MNVIQRVGQAIAGYAEEHRWREELEGIAAKVYTIASYVFLVAISVGLYLANPSLFALGFLVGLVLSDKVKEVSARVQQIFAAKPWLVILVGVGSFLAAPVAIAAGSFSCGAYLASQIDEQVPN